MISFAAISATAAEITGGRVNARKGVIELDVVYGGGCKKHQFKLEVGGCLESLPVQCGARLVDLTKDDFCEAIIHEKVEISLRAAGLNNSYYQRASLTIMGSNNSKVTVRLP